MHSNPPLPSETRRPDGVDGTVAADAPSTWGSTSTSASLAAVRAAVDLAARRTRLTTRQIDEVVLAVSEVVANAHRHGAPPVRIVLAARSQEVEVRVSDAGPGPDHLDVAAAARDACPVPADAVGGRGLWLAHRSCDEVEVTADETGCSVRLVVRAARP